MTKEKPQPEGHYWGSRGTSDPDPEARPLPGGFAEEGKDKGAPPSGEAPSGAGRKIPGGKAGA